MMLRILVGERFLPFRWPNIRNSYRLIRLNIINSLISEWRFTVFPLLISILIRDRLLIWTKIDLIAFVVFTCDFRSISKLEKMVSHHTNWIWFYLVNSDETEMINRISVELKAMQINLHEMYRESALCGSYGYYGFWWNSPTVCNFD